MPRSTRSGGAGRTATRAGTTTRKSAPRSRSFTAYHTAHRYLEGRPSVERTRPSRVDPDAFKLERMKAVLAKLGDPQRDTKFVHVAGSKGKGSTAEMIAACLGGCGYATGVFTSPHLVHVRERIRVGSEAMDEGSFTKLMGKVATAGEAVRRRHGEMTYFEALTALAFLHFATEAVDLAVVEVGLGGRLDCTNVIDPEVVAMTSIQLEHTELLGDSLGAIAREKAGVFKPGITAVTVPQADEVMTVFREEAERVGATLRVLGEDVSYSMRFEASPELGPHARVSLTSPVSSYEHLPVPLKGEHQAANCGLALAVMDKLRDRGYDTNERSVAGGLERTLSNGRMELAWDRPRILIDGAHNPESVEALVKAIGAHIPYDSMVVVFGCAADKNVEAMLHKISLGADKVIFTRATDNPRAMDPADLLKQYEDSTGKSAQAIEPLRDAVNHAVKGVGREDLICVTGSFYLVGEAKRLLQEARAKREA